MRGSKSVAIALFMLFVAWWSTSASSDSNEVRDFIKFFFEKTGEISNYSKAKKKESEFLALARDNIDVEWIANFVLGKHRKNLDKDQKNQFIETYSNYLVTSYRSILGIYSSNNYEILSVLEQQKGKIFIVNTVLSFNSKKVRNSFRVAKKNNKYYITDVTSEGISFISAKRAEIDAALVSKGFDRFMEDLKSSMLDKNKK
ncbi:MAG: ABC transporter substrate-binding protein [Rickettsiales bacterium]|jgi:ABC-type transporter MlaC component|nr:ABC transporter substrate-binding protein [Rickettsiales bacterium]